jgi:hypothetical protein
MMIKKPAIAEKVLENNVLIIFLIIDVLLNFYFAKIVLLLHLSKKIREKILSVI